MAINDLESRRARYFTLSSHIAHIDNRRMRALLDTPEQSRGWGRNDVIDVGGSKVFVKRIPMTDLEYDNMFSTRNLYELPTSYNYGVASAGSGIFRELVATIKTTNWVLEGTTPNFPLLYHYRILSISGEPPTIDMERHQGYVEYWNGNENIGRYVLDRANARYELALFMEYMPYSLRSWLLQNPANISAVLTELRSTIDFLRSNGIVHFDAHFDNVLTDGEHVYLTDFGLALDERFDLSEEETAFLKQHSFYDYAEILASVGFQLLGVHDALSDDEKRRITQRYGVPDDTPSFEVLPVLLANIEESHAQGIMPLEQDYVDTIVQYHSIIMLFIDFFFSMRNNHKKDTPFPHAVLSRLLEETGFVSSGI